MVGVGLKISDLIKTSLFIIFLRNEDTEYIAYVSEQLLADDLDLPVNHPQINEIFGAYDRGQYQVLTNNAH